MNCKTLLTIIKHLRIYSSLSTFSVMLRPLLERHLFHWSLVFIVISAKINISSYFKHVFSSGSKDECTFSIIQNKYYTGYGPWSSGLWGINRDCFEKCVKRPTWGCRLASSSTSLCKRQFHRKTKKALTHFQQMQLLVARPLWIQIFSSGGIQCFCNSVHVFTESELSSLLLFFTHWGKTRNMALRHYIYYLIRNF